MHLYLCICAFVHLCTCSWAFASMPKCQCHYQCQCQCHCNANAKMPKCQCQCQCQCQPCMTSNCNSYSFHVVLPRYAASSTFPELSNASIEELHKLGNSIQRFLANSVLPALSPKLRSKCVVDVAALASGCQVIELNPFAKTTGASMFSWVSNGDQLVHGFTKLDDDDVVDQPDATHATSAATARARATNDVLLDSGTCFRVRRPVAK